MISKEQIVDLYKNGKSAYEILPLTNYKCVQSIYQIIRKSGFTMRSKAGIKNSNLKHDYFNKIDTELKAYFLGLIYADEQLKLEIKANLN